MDRKNKGIDLRNQKDAEIKEKEAVDYKAKLEAKSQLYENLGNFVFAVKMEVTNNFYS